MSFEWRTNTPTETRSTSEGRMFSIPSTGAPPALAPIPPRPTPSNASSTTVTPMPGDDLSPPNATKHLNGIAVPVSASAGWSTSPPRLAVYPSRVAYELRLSASDSLEMAVALEYSNPRSSNGESMVVQVAVAKTMVHGDTQLALVATQFQEFVHGNWVDITAHIDYTNVADAVVDAVLQDPTAGQTAGKATVAADTIDLKLGPFGPKARVVLTFQAESLYTYQAMSVADNATDIGSHRLLPLWVVLPFATVQHDAGLARLSVRLSAPHGTAVLPTNQAAYQHLKQQEEYMKETTVLVVSELTSQGPDRVGYQLEWESLPPRSCGVLAWLALPNIPDDFVDVGRELGLMAVSKPSLQAVVQVPAATDARSLQVPLPGHGPQGSLYRVHVQMPKAQPRAQAMFLLNLTLSDKSGSTAMTLGGGLTMRQRFNELAEARFLKRLESIPALVQAGVLRLDDVWMDAFLAFDSTAPKSTIHRVSFRIRDAVDSIVAVVQAIRTNNDAAQLPSIRQHVQALRGVTPGGLTDFSVGPKTIAEEYKNWKTEAMAMLPPEATTCTFVEFDTDGGHNRGQGYLDSIKQLCEVTHVKNGVVTGFGSWLNQDCASKVARILGSVPAQLALQVPEPGAEGLNHIFRRGFSAWVHALRQPPPLTVELEAGSVAFSSRTANAVEVLALQRLRERHDGLPKFGPPNVANEDYTVTVIKDVPAGDELIFYLVSRLETPAQLATALEIRTMSGGEKTKARVVTEAESTEGNFIAYDWLNMLSKKAKKGFVFSPLMATSLATRLEDEVSFRFNIASPSGRTSYLGRCKTVANRAAIDSAHQPPAPSPPIKFDKALPPAPAQPFGAPSSRKLYKAPPSAPAPSVLAFGGAPAPSAFRGGRAGGGLFGSSPAPAFGAAFGGAMGGGTGFFSPATAPASPLFAPSTTGQGFFGSPSLGSAPSPATVSSSLVSRETDKPLWASAMLIPVGSTSPSKQDFEKLKDAIGVIALAKQQLLRDPTISYYCDICRRQLGPDEDRFHCFDCNGFDTCSNCQNEHKIPLHRLHNVTRSGSTTSAAEDPLVSSLLKPTTQSPTAKAGPPKLDRTLEWSKLIVQRFLLSVLHWWPLFRATCSFCDRLPNTIPDDLAQNITHCTQDGSSLDDLLNAATIVIDSLVREDKAASGQAISVL